MRTALSTIIGLVIGVALPLLLAASATKSLPGRAPMHSHLLNPSAEWSAYYDVAPEDERVLFWTVKSLVAVAREQAQQIEAMEKRLKDLEVFKANATCEEASANQQRIDLANQKRGD